MAGSDESKRPPGSAGIPFIVSSNLEKADPLTRKFIRSHVMRGKKQKKVRPDKGHRKTNKGAMAIRTEAPRVRLEEVGNMYTSLLPSRVGSDLSFAEFDAEIELPMLLNMAKGSYLRLLFLPRLTDLEPVTPFARRVIFPLMVEVGFEEDNNNRLYTVGRDAAHLHITAFAVEGFIDRVLRRRESNINPAAVLHFQKGLALLRERLLGEDDEAKISDSTISVVLKLADTAHFDGDYQTSKKHMEGLRKMVDMRGGLEVFRGKDLQVGMLR